MLDTLEDADSWYTDNALRWAARGLPPDMALKKASVDMEITANTANKKRKEIVWQII